jgi:hypothetical protein
VDAAIGNREGVSFAVDRAVEPGRRYWYRLVRDGGGGPLVFGEVAATAGSLAPEFALKRISPNPSRGLTRVEFTLAREAEVRLSVVDLQGREVAVLAQGVHRPGSHVATWSGEGNRGPSPTGLYFVRYRVAGQTVTERLALTR